MNIRRVKARPEMVLFFALLSLIALGNGLSDSIYGNYLNDVYKIDEVQRGLIEFPRELPGLLCALMIAALSPLGDLRSAVVAQVLACVGLTLLGLFTPAMGVMLVFLFINSSGMHLFMPLRDSIGMSLAEPGMVGKRMGQYASVQSIVSMGAAALVFIGFRSGFFTFNAGIKWVFIVGAAAFAAAIVASVMLCRIRESKKVDKSKMKLLFRKEYKYYYLMTVLHGVQKQITYVYGTWVFIKLLMKPTDTMALLGIASSFACIFFMRLLGKWIDKYGIKKMMYCDALSFIVIYVIYGLAVWYVARSGDGASAFMAATLYALFILDRLSMQMGVVKSVYLREIARSEEDVTRTLSTGTSLDHVVAIIAATVCGAIWTVWGPQYVFFTAALFSLGNLYAAWKVKLPQKGEAVSG